MGKISGLPVVDSGRALVGIVTGFDLARALRAGEDLAVTPVDELMSRDVITIEADAPVDDVMEGLGAGEDPPCPRRRRGAAGGRHVEG